METAQHQPRPVTGSRPARRSRASVCPTPPQGARPKHGVRAPRPVGAGAGARSAQGARGVERRAETRISSACPVANVAGVAACRVHKGVDFCKVSYWCNMGQAALDYMAGLEARKLALQATDGEEFAPVKLAGTDWNLARTGTRHFPFRLISGDVVLLLSRRSAGSNTPSARVEIGSLTSQTCLFETLENIRRLFREIGAEERREQIAELHLAADFIGVDLQGLDLENSGRWISKARHFGVFREHWCLTGVTVGKGDLMLRVYDKVAELKAASHKQDVFSSLWGVENYNDQPVVRVEYQLRRPVLKNFFHDEDEDEHMRTLGNVEFLLRALASIWSYCCGDWSRFCDTVVDRKNKHQWRANLSEFWEVVKGVVWVDVFHVERGKPEIYKDFERIRKQAVGLFMSVASFFCNDIYDFDTIRMIGNKIINEDLVDFFENDEQEFIRRMMIKRNAALMSI